MFCCLKYIRVSSLMTVLVKAYCFDYLPANFLQQWCRVYEYINTISFSSSLFQVVYIEIMCILVETLFLLFVIEVAD